MSAPLKVLAIRCVIAHLLIELRFVTRSRLVALPTRGMCAIRHALFRSNHGPIAVYCEVHARAEARRLGIELPVGCSEIGTGTVFQIGIADRSATSLPLFKAVPPRRKIRRACCFRKERPRQLCTVLAHPLLRYKPSISSEFPQYPPRCYELLHRRCRRHSPHKRAVCRQNFASAFSGSFRNRS
jgi:hypothetical protein